MQKEDLLSIPDAVTLKEAREDEEFNFLFSKVKSKKPKFDLNKYICFHKELRFGVYKHENKYYLAKIKKSIHVGKYVKPHIQVVGELTKHGENWDHLKAGLSGATFLNKGSESEQLFLQSIVEKQRKLDEQRIAEEKKAEVRQRELDEQIAEEKKAEEKQRKEEKKAEARQRELDEQIAEEKKAEEKQRKEEKKAEARQRELDEQIPEKKTAEELLSQLGNKQREWYLSRLSIEQREEWMRKNSSNSLFEQERKKIRIEIEEEQKRIEIKEEQKRIEEESSFVKFLQGFPRPLRWIITGLTLGPLLCFIVVLAVVAGVVFVLLTPIMLLALIKKDEPIV